MYRLKDDEILFVFTGPHGAGRKTVAEMSGATLGVKQVLSYTTRPPRPTEVEGQDYRFISPVEFFNAQSKGEFLEVMQTDSHFYGVKSQDVANMLHDRGSAFLILNAEGATKLKDLYGDKLVRIMIYVDRKTLVQRMKENGESDADIERYNSHYDSSVAYRSECEHSFENVDLAHTVFDLTKTLDTYLNRNLVDMD
ncbi:guanylate kinase [Paenibacillus sp. N1-5-1-14]|uniref:guanylate kinase n=1 Tax=Paenibacillus radicibacter TaxID=2972488 RepID=UPI0021595FDB|nr:guanylate kinase [Paenibacillus radicibacter]MCR8643195.1 guanylate kinase [Paenibacillus radicibacter]